MFFCAQYLSVFPIFLFPFSYFVFSCLCLILILPFPSFPCSLHPAHIFSFSLSSSLFHIFPVSSFFSRLSLYFSLLSMSIFLLYSVSAICSVFFLLSSFFSNVSFPLPLSCFLFPSPSHSSSLSLSSVSSFLLPLSRSFFLPISPVSKSLYILPPLPLYSFLPRPSLTLSSIFFFLLSLSLPSFYISLILISTSSFLLPSPSLLRLSLRFLPAMIPAGR